MKMFIDYNISNLLLYNNNKNLEYIWKHCNKQQHLAKHLAIKEMLNAAQGKQISESLLIEPIN